LREVLTFISKDRIEDLRKAYEIWVRRKRESKIDAGASRVFKDILGQIEATEKSTDSLRTEDEAQQKPQYDTTQLPPHSHFDLTSDQAGFVDWVRSNFDAFERHQLTVM
jgi:hypothetical protein